MKPTSFKALQTVCFKTSFLFGTTGVRACSACNFCCYCLQWLRVLKQLEKHPFLSSCLVNPEFDIPKPPVAIPALN
ncbi:hypothetical protein HMPREF9554_00565 [Treponema phagedenis F0421]|nr:hypothetical protein HMPREF9554_00565 [Treponema phagedenis F0421]